MMKKSMMKTKKSTKSTKKRKKTKKLWTRESPLEASPRKSMVGSHTIVTQVKVQAMVVAED